MVCRYFPLEGDGISAANEARRWTDRYGRVVLPGRGGQNELANGSSIYLMVAFEPDEQEGIAGDCVTYAVRHRRDPRVR